MSKTSFASAGSTAETSAQQLLLPGIKLDAQWQDDTSLTIYAYLTGRKLLLAIKAGQVHDHYHKNTSAAWLLVVTVVYSPHHATAAMQWHQSLHLQQCALPAHLQQF